jgi:MFS family permease
MTSITAVLPSATARDGGAVSWGAVFAGAVGAAAFSLILILLGSGLGLSVVSPWANEGVSAGTASISTIAWITVVQILASVLGGYLAGRLRSRWVTVHTHEVYFRDTAHGFLAWSVATLLMATLLSSAVGSIVSTGVKATGAVAMTGAAAVAGVATAKGDDGSQSVGYSVDSLFRASAPAAAPDANGVPATPANKTAEVTRIFANGLRSGELGEADTQYLGQLVAAKTGLSQADAEKRVTDTFTQLRQTLQQASDKAKKVADDARKASAYLALWLVISLLIGAFVASLAATFGGRLRDSSVLANP